MGVNYGCLSQLSAGNRPMSNTMREKMQAVLGEVSGQGVVYCQGGIVQGESTFIREPAREVRLSLGELGHRVGVSPSSLSMASRGIRNLGPRTQARVEEALLAPVKGEAAQFPCVEPQVLWERMDAHQISQNETARRAGISSSPLSQTMNGERTPSGRVLKGLHAVLFQPTTAEQVAPVELKVMAWKKGERSGVVSKGPVGHEAMASPATAPSAPVVGFPGAPSTTVADILG